MRVSLRPRMIESFSASCLYNRALAANQSFQMEFQVKIKKFRLVVLQPWLLGTSMELKDHQCYLSAQSLASSKLI